MDTGFMKYPRTGHIKGSGIQKGDAEQPVTPIEKLRNKHLVVEEKLDGANCGISFVDEKPRLQSRGHILTGGPRELQFNMFKAWALTHRFALNEILSERYIMFGEWMYAKHTEFYDRLPHYFLEFDVYDRITKQFLSTTKRREMFKNSPVVSVPVLFSGTCDTLEHLTQLIKPSLYKSDEWKKALINAAKTVGLSEELVLEQSDDSSLSEGLYVKHENDDVVLARYKFVRAAFTQQLESDEHWMTRRIVPNRLAGGVDIFR